MLRNNKHAAPDGDLATACARVSQRQRIDTHDTPLASNSAVAAPVAVRAPAAASRADGREISATVASCLDKPRLSQSHAAAYSSVFEYLQTWNWTPLVNNCTAPTASHGLGWPLPVACTRVSAFVRLLAINAGA